jgi:hypothetical protein
MRPRLLLSTRNTDYRHDSIPAGVDALEGNGTTSGTTSATIRGGGARVDAATYTGGTMGGDHPIEAYGDPVSTEHVRGGINSLRATR